MTKFELLIEKLADNRKKGPVILLTLDGELDETNIEEHSPAIYKIIENGDNHQTLIFNLQRLRYMNSKAIGYMADWSNKIRAKGGQIIIVETPDNIKDVLVTIGIDDLFKEYQTLEIAKKDIYDKK